MGVLGKPVRPAPNVEKEVESRSLSSINAELVSHGFAKRPLKLDALSSADQAQLASVLCEILQSNSTKVSALEDSNAKLRSLEYENDRYYKTIEKNERSVERMEVEVQNAKAQVAHAEHRVKEEENKAKALRQDVIIARKALDNMRTAATQEAKRAQLKLDKVLAQLARQVPVVPPTFELMNPIPPGHITPVAAGPIPLIEASLADLSSLRKSLQEEIEAFRHVAVSTANSLREALAAGLGDDPPPRLLPDEFYAQEGTSRHIRQVASWKAHPAIADARLKALVSDIRTALTTNVSPIMRDGSGATEAEAEEAEESKRLDRLREREMGDLRDRVKDLEVELQIACAKNEEANKVVEQMAKLSVQTTVPSTTDFEDSRLRDELVRQKRVLDSERESLRERTMRMIEERMALDAAKAAFEADRQAAIAAAVSEAQLSAQAESSSSSSEPLTPTKHRAASPSLLSPHARRSPKPLHGPHAHVAVRRRAVPRTPLSRLVLERAVLERDRSRKVSGSKSSQNGHPGGTRPARPLGESVRDNSSATADETQSREKGVDKTPPERRQSGDKPKSSLMAGTAASAARSKAEKIMGAKSKSKAWR